VSSGTRRKTGGSITAFKLGKQVIDSGIRWCMFYSFAYWNGLNFLRAPCPAGKRNWCKTRISMFFKLRASPEMLLSSCETRRDLQFGKWTDLSFSRHYVFVLRQREESRAKELSENTRIWNSHSGRRIKMICDNCHFENNKTHVLINKTFPPSTTSAGKIFFNWKGKKKTNFPHKHEKNWIHTEQSDCNLHNVRDVTTT